MRHSQDMSAERRIGRELRTFSITLELNFCTESAQTFPLNCRMTASLNRWSFKSRMYCTTCKLWWHQYQKRSTNDVLTPKKTYIVAVRVLHERQGVVCDLVDELDPLMLGGMVDAALEHAAAMAVRGDLDAVRRDGVVNELDIDASHSA